MSKKQRAFYIILAAMLLNMNSVSMFASADDEVNAANSTGVVSQSEEDTSFEKAYEKSSEKTNAVQSEKSMSVNTAASAPDIKQIADHKWSKWTVTKRPTVTQTGLQMRTCSECGKKEIMPVRKQSLRIFGANRFDTSLEIAKQYRKENGNKLFSNVIIVSGMQFPDALSASYLASVKDAPIIVTSDSESVMNNVAAFVKDNSEKKANVYIVGGSGAVSENMVKKLAGYNVKRVWGSNRFTTNLETIKEAGGTNDEIIIASGMNYPDALSASAVGKPILLVQGKALNQQQQEFLGSNPKAKAVIVGGTGAVSSEIEKQVKKLVAKTERLSGSNRYETSKMVAERFFGENASTVMLSYGLNFPDGLCGGPLAAKYGAPLLMADNNSTKYAADYAATVGKDAESIVSGAVTLGGNTLISDESIKKIIPEAWVQSVFTTKKEPADFIITQPKDWSGSTNDVASFSVTVNTQNAAYCWQSSLDGRAWQDIDGADSSCYSVNADVKMNGLMYRCVVTASCGETIVSDTAKIFVSSDLSVVTQPQDWGGGIDSIAYLYTQANSSMAEYNWQYSNDNGKTWQNAGANEQECRVKLTSNRNGRIYRCIITDMETNESVVTCKVKLYIVTDYKIVAQPQTISGDFGSAQRLTVQSGGSGLTYQWQFSKDGQTDWTDIVNTNYANKARLYQSVTTSNIGNYYRCLINDSQGQTTVSNSVRILASNRGFVKYNERVYYICENGLFATGLNMIDNDLYYFSDNGIRQTGFVTLNGVRYYFDDESGKSPKGFFVSKAGYTYYSNGTEGCLTGLQTIDGELYYFYENGVMGTGLITVNNTKYYFDLKNGRAITGFVTSNAGYTYYSNGQHGCLTGLQSINGELYYFYDSGIMMVSKCKEINDNTYYFTENGSAATGFRYIPEYLCTFYFDTDHKAHTGWLELDGKKYYYYPKTNWLISGTPGRGLTYDNKGTLVYLDPETAEQKTGLVQVGLNRFMYFDPKSGNAVSGLKKIDGSLYLFSDAAESFGVSLWGMQTIGNDTYYFDETTQIAVSGFVTSSSNTYYFDRDFKMVKGMQMINGNRYYFHPEKGFMTSGIYTIDGAVYCFGDNGTAITGWYETENGDKYYFSEKDNKAYTGVHIIGGKKYYFASNGKSTTGLIKDSDGQYHYITNEGQSSGFIQLNGSTYYVDANGCVLTGLQTIGDDLFYFSQYGVMLTGAYTIDDKRYFFESDTGKAATGFVERENGYTYYYDGANGVKTGLVTINGKMYYLSNNGNLIYGKRQIGDKYYFFDPQTGAAVSGWRMCVTSAGDIYRCYYSPDDYSAVVGLKQIDGSYFYFSSTGLALSGSNKVNGVSMYFDPNTQKLYTGPVSINGKIYYSDGLNGLKQDSTQKVPANAFSWGTIDGQKCYYGINGKPITGLQLIDKKLCMFDANGELLTGLISYKGVTRYYTENGVLTGLQTINGSNYYFSSADASMIKGLRIISDVKYSFDDDGRNSEGWIVVNGNYRCYIDHSKGMLTGLQQIDGKWYWFGTSGIMRTGVQTVTDSAGAQKVCLFGEDGSMVYGLVQINDKLYYFDEKTGERATGWKTIKGKTYYFDLSSGAAYKGRKSINDRIYCFDQSTGEQLLGLVRINNALYCFSDKTSDGLVHGLTEIEGDLYCFNDTSGAAITGFVNLNDIYYYFSPTTGKAEEGIRWVSKTSAYYFEKEGGVRKGLVTYEGDKYYCYPSSGKVSTGLMSIGNKLYCFDDNGAMMRNTIIVIAGLTYSIDENGYVTVEGSSNLAKIVRSGIEKLGTPYAHGYELDDNFDPTNGYNCSSFVSVVLQAANISVPFTAYWQYQRIVYSNEYSYEFVNSLSEAQPGDVVYLVRLSCEYGNTCEYLYHIHHVMIYLGDGKVLHSTNTDYADHSGVVIQNHMETNDYFTYRIIRFKSQD